MKCPIFFSIRALKQLQKLFFSCNKSPLLSLLSKWSPCSIDDDENMKRRISTVIEEHFEEADIHGNGLINFDKFNYLCKECGRKIKKRLEDENKRKI